MHSLKGIDSPMKPTSNSIVAPPTQDRSPTSGRLLALLIAAFYGLFTLLPNSNSLMVSWPWVFIWQVGLICPVLWLLGLLWQRRLAWLGNRIDWVVGLLVAGLVISSSLAPFPMQARWYSWAVFCFLAALYALNTWLMVPERRTGILVTQGYLNIAFIIVSLGLWSSQTLFPELARLQELHQYGVTLPFDFSTLELRNWAPIGHQNYVAGYLTLALPLLLGLGIWQTGWRRWLWFGGAGLGLIDLYTTSSRGGWLGIVVAAIAGMALLLWRSTFPRRWLWGVSASGLLVLVLLIVANNRLRTVGTAVFTGQAGGELAYRFITTTTGWRMGLSRLLTGVGPGGVPLLFQQYRPHWAGREAELAYQLHSTPAQLWAELGVWGVVTVVGAIVLLTYLGFRYLRESPTSNATPPVLIASIFCSLLAYSLVSFTDYQLDNVCISGTLVIYLAVLATEFRSQKVERQELGGFLIKLSTSSRLRFPVATSISFVPLAGLGILLAAIIWLIPVHRAWLLSSQGFAALSRNDIAAFADRLERSQQLAPWEPYYPNQLGWNLGNASLQSRDPGQQQKLIESGIAWLRRGIEAAPQQEFGHTTLAWLLLNRNPAAAMQEFADAARLVPAKRGVFYGLGLSLLAQGKTDLAIAALSLEVLRDPVLITSPLWRLPQFQPLYGKVVSQVDARYTALLEKSQGSEVLTAQLHQSRGGLRWWRGDLAAARKDLDSFGTPLSRIVLDLAEGKSVQLPQEPPLGGTLAIAAWLNPAQRQDLLQQAWVTATRTAPPSGLLPSLVDSMNRSSSFDQWLKQNAPSREYRRERAGFGVLSRHIDGPVPIDFLTVVENIPVAQFFDQLVPSFFYVPELDAALQPERDALLQKISPI